MGRLGVDVPFDATVPVTQAHSDSAATGSAEAPAHRDHQHGMPAEGGGAAQATQAALEAETNEDTYPPPDLIKHSPGVAKGYCTIQANGTLNAGSFNVASVTDTGVGNRTIVWDVDFADSNYATVQGLNTGSDTPFNLATISFPVGSTVLQIRDTDANALADAASTVAALGNQ